MAASLPQKVTRRGFGISSSSSLRSQELTFSALIARTLDRFLFDDDKVRVGMCLHQGPVRKKEGNPANPEAADLYILQRSPAGEPSTPILVSDIKLDAYFLAFAETSLYARYCVNLTNEDEQCPLILALLLTRLTTSLHMCVIGHDDMWHLPIIQPVLLQTVVDLQALLCTVYAGVHHLFNQSMMEEAPLTHAKPFRHKEWFTPLGTTNRAFKHNACVVTIFDTKETHLKPNVELLNAVYDMEVAVEKLTPDGRFVLLQYPYFTGSHTPTALNQFSGIVRMLHTLHDRGYVHADVRGCNIVFSSSPPNSWLSDFDLAQAEGTLYPQGYIHHKKERHPNAIEGQRMSKLHDRYDLALVMQTVQLQPSAQPTGNRLVDQVNSEASSLCQLADELMRLPC